MKRREARLWLRGNFTGESSISSCSIVFKGGDLNVFRRTGCTWRGKDLSVWEKCQSFTWGSWEGLCGNPLSIDVAKYLGQSAHKDKSATFEISTHSFLSLLLWGFGKAEQYRQEHPWEWSCLPHGNHREFIFITKAHSKFIRLWINDSVSQSMMSEPLWSSYFPKAPTLNNVALGTKP